MGVVTTKKNKVSKRMGNIEKDYEVTSSPSLLDSPPISGNDKAEAAERRRISWSELDTAVAHWQLLNLAKSVKRILLSRSM